MPDVFETMSTLEHNSLFSPFLLLYLFILVRALPELTGRVRKTMRRRAFTRQLSSKGSNLEEEQRRHSLTNLEAKAEEQRAEVEILTIF